MQTPMEKILQSALGKSPYLKARENSKGVRLYFLFDNVDAIDFALGLDKDLRSLFIHPELDKFLHTCKTEFFPKGANSDLEICFSLDLREDQGFVSFVEIKDQSQCSSLSFHGWVNSKTNISVSQTESGCEKGDPKMEIAAAKTMIKMYDLFIDL